MDEDRVLRSLVRDDAYKVVRVLAEGPSGKTELVTLGDSNLLVRKRIPAALSNAGAWATLMGVSEPRLPHIEELYEMPDELVVVYSYVQGQSLGEVVKAEGPLPPARAAAIVAQVCEAASALHAAGLVHRDITPGNVILADDGAHLVDLGIARRQREDGARDTSVLGTWGFAAPEQFGFTQTDQRSDVYALGRLLGFLVTGVLPSDDAYAARLDDLQHANPALVQIVAKASAFEPSARYQRAVDLQTALEGLARGEAEVLPSGTPQVSAPKAFSPADSGAQAAARKAHQAPVSPLQATLFTDKAQVRGPRRFGEAPLAARVAAIVAWLLGMGYILLVALVAIDVVTKGEPAWGLYEVIIAITTCGAVAVMAREIYEAVLLKGPYTVSRYPLLRAVLELCKILAITFSLLILLAMVIYLVNK